MSIDGKTIFRAALLIESAANIGSVFQTILTPEWCISKLASNSTLIAPTSKAFMQWLGGVIVMATAPLLLSYPGPGAGETAGQVTARRRLTYMMLGAGEAALGALTLSQYLAGDSGLSDITLLTATGMMGAFLGMRGFFLYVKPAWMEPQESGKKMK